MPEIKTARIGNKLFVMNGVDNLAFVDLTKVNKGSKRKAIVRYTPIKRWSFSYRLRIHK